MMHTEALRRWRTDHQLTQEEVARAIGVSNATYRTWEREKEGAPANRGPGTEHLQMLEAFKPGLFDLLRPEPGEWRFGEEESS